MDFDEPLKFVLGEGGVIEGWERGLVGTCPGEKIELTIPPELGYGEEGKKLEQTAFLVVGFNLWPSQVSKS